MGGVTRARQGPRGVRLRHLYFKEGGDRLLAKRIAKAFVELHGYQNVEPLIKPTFFKKIPKDAKFKRLSIARIRNDIANFKDREHEVIVELIPKLQRKRS
ncbi:hypothetical protein HY989_04135 [Candidatus Micrarchaeota archaeon]|nr:hypothetical protein [Candidatus Micrarchaeota archaeon]